jgi:hypothetical protein
MQELTFIKLCPFLLKVVMSHVKIIPTRSVQLRNQVQPQGHLMTTVMVPHLWPQSCNMSFSYYNNWITFFKQGKHTNETGKKLFTNYTSVHNASHLFSSFFSLSQHVSAIYGHHQVFFCQKLFHCVVYPTSSITYECDMS